MLTFKFLKAIPTSAPQTLGEPDGKPDGESWIDETFVYCFSKTITKTSPEIINEIR